MAKPDIYLRVPRLNQLRVFPTARNAKNMACWYTSAFMVLLYRMGVTASVNMIQLDTLKRLYLNEGLGLTEDESLAKEVGLEHSPSSVLFPKKGSAEEFCKALEHLGPLVFSTAQHVIVVTGCFSGIAGGHFISVNDPDGGREQTYSLVDFNSQIAWKFPIHFRRTKYEPPSVFKAGPNMHPFQSKY